MSKKTESYEEQILKEFESTQQPQTEVVRDLGKVNIGAGYVDINEDPEIIRIKNTMDYVNIPLNCLPSQGRFYPDDTRIMIRAARVDEIRQFSTIDEEDPKDIRDKMTYIISQCVKVYFGNTPGHYKDIIDGDRVPLILKIRELTFIDGQSSIKIPVPNGACKTPDCKPQDTIDFNSNLLEFVEPNHDYDKYYDQVEKCYNIKTKSFGDIKLYIPTIGVSTAISNWIRQQQLENKNFDVSLVDILQYVVKDWRTLTDRQIFNKMTEIAGWPTKKFTLIYRIKEELGVDIKSELRTTCAQCGGELVVPITFPDGFKSLFVPTISDIGDELL